MLFAGHGLAPLSKRISGVDKGYGGMRLPNRQGRPVSVLSHPVRKTNQLDSAFAAEGRHEFSHVLDTNTDKYVRQFLRTTLKLIALADLSICRMVAVRISLCGIGPASGKKKVDT